MFSIESILEILKTPFLQFISPGDRGYWLYIVFSLVIAIIVYLFRSLNDDNKPFLERLSLRKLRETFFHRSAIVDYKFFFINRILMVLVILPFIYGISSISPIVTEYLSGIWDPVGYLPSNPFLASLLLTIVLLLVGDFFIYFTHYLQHKLPILWEFHKTHHSAEVLTPMTAFRMHPVDDILVVGAGLVATSLLHGLYVFTFAPEVSLITAANVNIFILVFYIFGFHLRHSPVYVSYGKFWEKFLVSPAMHQIHHSSDRSHYDSNFGFMFSFWDSLFKTRVESPKDLEIVFGIGGEEKEMQSVSRLYFRPFKKCYTLLRNSLS